MEEFKTINKNVVAEIIEKKSKFIAHIFYVETPEEADKYIKEIQRMVYYSKHYRQYWSISYLDELIDEVIKAIESHTRESKVDFSKYIN